MADSTEPRSPARLVSRSWSATSRMAATSETRRSFPSPARAPFEGSADGVAADAADAAVSSASSAVGAGVTAVVSVGGSDDVTGAPDSSRSSSRDHGSRMPLFRGVGVIWCSPLCVPVGGAGYQCYDDGMAGPEATEVLVPLDETYRIGRWLPSCP